MAYAFFLIENRENEFCNKTFMFFFCKTTLFIITQTFQVLYTLCSLKCHQFSSKIQYVVLLITKDLYTFFTIAKISFAFCIKNLLIEKIRPAKLVSVSSKRTKIPPKILALCKGSTFFAEKKMSRRNHVCFCSLTAHTTFGSLPLFKYRKYMPFDQ